MSQGRGRDSSRRKRDGSILKNSRERRASAVRERIGPCVIVLYKSPNGHRLHRMRKDSNCRVVDPVAAQNKMTRSCALSFVVRRFAMAYSLPPALGECGHGRLARRLVAVRRRTVLIVPRPGFETLG